MIGIELLISTILLLLWIGIGVGIYLVSGRVLASIIWPLILVPLAIVITYILISETLDEMYFYWKLKRQNDRING